MAILVYRYVGLAEVAAGERNELILPGASDVVISVRLLLPLLLLLSFKDLYDLHIPEAASSFDQHRADGASSPTRAPEYRR